jgi:hypothetical protein
MTPKHQFSLGLALLALLTAVTASIAAPRIHALRSGEPLGNLSGEPGSEHLFVIDVPRGAHLLEVRTYGGRGDCDLYVRHGRAPGKFEFDGQSVGGSTEERLIFENPQPGRWYIAIRAFIGFENVNLLVRVNDGGVGVPEGQVYPLEPDQRIRDLASEQGGFLYFKLDVPRRARNLVVRTGGGRGDSDLYISRGELPTPKKAEYRSNRQNNDETITIADPATGEYFILVYAYNPYRNLQLEATYAGGEPRRVITILTPRTGDLWQLGDTEPVTWQAGRRVGAVQIQFSLDDGVSWSTRGLPEQIDAAAGRYDIRLPLREHWASDNARIRIVDLDNPNQYDVSGRFRIIPARGDEWNQLPIPLPWIFPGEPREQPGRHHPRPDRDRLVDAYEPDNNSDHTRLLQHGQTQVHTITEDDEDWIAIEPGFVGDLEVTFEEVTVPLKVDVRVREVGRRERELQEFRVPRGGGTARLTASDRTQYFKLRVRAQDDDETGQYSVSLAAVPVAGRRGDHGGAFVAPEHLENIPVLKHDEKIREIEANRGQRRYFRVFVPRGTDKLFLGTEDGEGNMDMFLEYGALPSTQSPLRSIAAGTGETIRVDTPRPGWWYVLMYARTDYEDVEIVARLTD